MTYHRFYFGDLVYIVNQMPPSQSHFEKGCLAIVLHSDKDVHGGKTDPNKTDYAVFIQNKGFTAWYRMSQLKLVEVNRKDLLEKWIDELEAQYNG